MTPRQIKWLDRWAGIPLCALLSAACRARRLLPSAPSGRPRRIVFVKLIEMGSTVLASAAFREAESLVGPDNLFVLAFTANRPILDVLPSFKPGNILSVDPSGPIAFARSLSRALARLRDERVDTAVDLEGLTRSSAIISYLTGCPVRVGYHNFTSDGPYRGRLFTVELTYNFQQHISRSFLAMVRALSAPRGQVPLLKEPIGTEDVVLPTFTPRPDESQSVLDLVRAKIPHLRAGGRLLLLNPNCSDLLPLRRWPNDSFADLGRRLLAQLPDGAVAVTGTAAEQEQALRLASQIGPADRAASLAGLTTLRQLLTLYSVSSLLVTNDSGPCHFAALTPVPLVALYGPETPILYGPLSRQAVALTAGLACSPCVSMLNHRFSPCTDNVCMRSISVERVLHASLSLLDSHPRPFPILP